MFSIALAQVDPPMTEETPAPVVLEIASDGTALLRGTVTEVGTDTLTVESWGGLWTIRVNDDGTVIPTQNGTTTPNDLGGFAVGDFVGAEGLIDGDAAMTINTSFVRNWTTNPLTDAFDDTTDTSTNTAPTTL